VSNCIQISRRYLSFLRKQNEESIRVGVNELLNDLSHLIRVHPSLQQNEFSIKPLTHDIMVRMNGTDLIQAVLNLAVNGFQCSSEPHSVAIEARVLPEPLDLTLFKDGPQERLMNMESFANTAPLVAICVRDTGPGIPPEVLPKIFQPYFTTKGNQQGTGLGLNIVQRLIREAHGALHVHTEQGEGTVFTVYLAGIPPAGN
jgi:signal transduction histidine kinase